ncbi:hypothetical protein [Actinomyces sp. MRS3W]|uniref:hypothetical protein n=1 Tax=Actinomyces sp. MRS3W TaxID=2800796 RepID=UPI0028FD4958|nr:hypothetical protein [Actinomyces sp. MRS3W]MDU0347866.1 hypothetical protein [Actinomyces sp. MRS3W]
MSVIVVSFLLLGGSSSAWANEVKGMEVGSSSGSVVSGGDGSVTVSVSAEFVSAADGGSGSGGEVVSSQVANVDVHEAR